MSVSRHVGENISDQEIKTTRHEEALQQTTEFQDQNNAKATSRLKMGDTTARQAHVTLIASDPSAEIGKFDISDTFDVTLVDLATSPVLIDALNQRKVPIPSLIEENKPENKGEKRKPASKHKYAPSTSSHSATQRPSISLTLGNSSVGRDLNVTQQVFLGAGPSTDFSFFTTQRSLFKVQGKDGKEKAVDLAKLERLTVQLTQILKSPQRKDQKTAGLG